MTTPLARRDFRQGLLIAMLLAVSLTAFTAWKWATLNYNGLDLAIYTQAMAETSHGRFMQLTIHPHSYFGDHIELILLALFPIYALLPSPFTLVVLQTLALASGVFPIILLARRRFPTGSLPLVAAAAYAIHPYLLNVATYEFHALALAVPLLLWTLLAYERKRWRWFLVGLLIALLVREDVGFVALGLGLLATVDRRSWRWRIIPALAGIVWLIATTKISGQLNTEGHYKFISYYAWLGPTLKDIVLNAIGHPLVVLRHLLEPTRLLVLIGLLLPFGYLPLLKPRMLIGVSFVLAQLLLAGIGENALKIHYTALLLPFLVVASLDGLASITDSARGRLRAFLWQEREAARLALVVVLVAASAIIGPVGALALDLRDRQFASAEDRRASWAVLDSLAKPVRGVVSFRLITPLAQSPQIYSANYVFLGHRQYVKQPYPVSPLVDTMLIDDRDLLTHQQIYPETVDEFREGNDRIGAFARERGLGLALQLGHLYLFRRGAQSPMTPTFASTDQRLDSTLRLTGMAPAMLATQTVNGASFRVLTFGLRFQATARMDRHRQLRLTIRDDRGQLQREYYELNPFHPTGTWQSGEEQGWTYRPILARQPQGALRLSVEVVELKGEGLLNGFRGIDARYTQIRQIGSTIGVPLAPN